ncbi:MAG TPA: thiamine pyrophosphate-binding protein [Acidimicrobiales bacterium]|nr:thiamine pyrophosphate-binding protein [Acidimicrobiales bacterium]
MTTSGAETGTVAAAIAACVADLGIRRVYGLPGEDHLLLLHELELAGCTYVPARDESAACIMAAAESQATGLPGLAVVTLAPGITNALNGLASAFLDHVPLLVVSGQHDPDRRPLIVRQSLDSHALVAPVTKWRATIGGHVHQLLAKALDAAVAPPAGPVFLELPPSVARSPALDGAPDWRPLLAGTDRPGPPVAPPGALAPVREALGAARRPVVLVGGRCPPDAGPPIARLAAALRAPAFTTPAAKGTLRDGDPFLAGTFLNGNLEAALLERADVVLAVGLDAYDFFNGPWRYGATILAVEPDATSVQRVLPARYQVVGDPRTLCEDLLAGELAGASAWEPGDVAAYRAGVLERFSLDDEALTIPAAIVDARSLLPDDTIVTVDAGFGKPLHALLWAARCPNACFSSQGLSTMGYAIPAANALKLVWPQRTVVAFLGDGSLYLRASEIGVAAEQGVAPIYVVWSDACLSQIAVKQDRQSLRRVGVDVAASSCERIAAAFGGVGWDVDSRASFRDALREAMASRAPALIGARVDQRSRASWFELVRG